MFPQENSGDICPHYEKAVPRQMFLCPGDNMKDLMPIPGRYIHFKLYTYPQVSIYLLNRTIVTIYKGAV